MSKRKVRETYPWMSESRKEEVRRIQEQLMKKFDQFEENLRISRQRDKMRKEHLRKHGTASPVPVETQPNKISTFSLKGKDKHDPDITIVAEKGEVACRDFPHFRHQCASYPFGKTPDKTYCRLCYCYVCDIAAPCKEWSDHCHATDKVSKWYHLRRERKRNRKL